MLQDKAVTQLGKNEKEKHFSAWYDFRKEYDSIYIDNLRRLIGNVPLHMNIKECLKGVLNLWSVQVKIDQDKTKPIHIKEAYIKVIP
ncbi:hypothetical protein JTB14_017245 [Gonioctena quinquepunctata]|nr:hypothetical protein JTB14_017245 [Gonioctena quinquepunctata]